MEAYVKLVKIRSQVSERRIEALTAGMIGSELYYFSSVAPLTSQ
jgi:hypothetical protein